MSQQELQALLAEYKNGLARLYGARLKGVFLFGSYARGDQDAESDLDMLVILNEVGQYSTEIRRTSELTSRLSLKYGVSISRVFIKQNDWLRADLPLVRNIHAEGISIG